MTIPSHVFDRIDAVVERQMNLDQIPGLSLAVTSRDGLVYQQTYGYASLESREPVQPDHLFEHGSIGKSFTCILLLQLAREGLLALDKPVTDYLPWFEVQSDYEPITLHHLMTHSAGITGGTDFPTDPRYEVWALRDTHAVQPPGERFHYSNAGYKTLGLILERVAGRPYAQLVHDRILAPLGMTDTEPAITHDTRKRLATGYQPFYDDRPWRKDHGLVPATWLETDTADGCLAGTAADLAGYLRMLMNGGEAGQSRILSEEEFAVMTTPHIDLDTPDDAAYGYGLRLSTRDGRHLLGHGGGMVGYYAHMLADLSSGFGLVTLINGPGDQEPIVHFALDALNADLRGQSLPELPPAWNRLSIDNAASYAGQYQFASGEIDVSASADRLYLRMDGETAGLEPRGNDAFLVDHPDFAYFLLRFERSDDGEIIAAAHGERYWTVPGRQEDEREAPTGWPALTGHYRSHNPWGSNFRIILRNGELILAHPLGDEARLYPDGDNAFRVGSEDSPESIRFDTIVEGAAWRAHLSGCDYYRFFTP